MSGRQLASCAEPTPHAHNGRPEAKPDGAIGVASGLKGWGQHRRRVRTGVVSSLLMLRDRPNSKRLLAFTLFRPATCPGTPARV
jgi:hypothetical protein